MESALAFLGTGTAGVAAADGTILAAPTAGLFGSAGAFSMGTTLMTAGTGLSAIGTIGNSVAQYNAAQFNSKVAAANAELAISSSERQATEILQNSEDQAQQLETKQHHAQATRAATIGASGLDMAGSALQVTEGADYEGNLDVAKIISGGTLAADNALLRGRVAASSYKAQSGLDSSQADTALVGGVLSTGTTLAKYGARRSGVGYGLSLSDFI